MTAPYYSDNAVHAMARLMCHCGAPTVTHWDGTARGLCEICDACRCDINEGACR